MTVEALAKGKVDKAAEEAARADEQTRPKAEETKVGQIVKVKAIAILGEIGNSRL